MDEFIARLNAKIDEAVRGRGVPLGTKLAKAKLELTRLQAKNERDKRQDRLKQDIATPPAEEGYIRQVEKRLNKALALENAKELMIDIWCPIHGAHSERMAALDVNAINVKCSFCHQALRDRVMSIRMQNAMATPGTCQFCGGPTPCLRDS